MVNGLICVHRSNVDLFFYIVGGADENELILMAALNAFYDAAALLLRCGAGRGARRVRTWPPRGSMTGATATRWRSASC